MSASDHGAHAPAEVMAEGKELVLTRTINAPRGLVFQAWINPVHLARWWGPHGFTNPVCELDVRPGGAIRIDMQAPDGTVYPMKGSFQEVQEPDRIVFTSTAFEDDQGRPLLENLNTVTFTEQDGKTTITLRAKVVRAAPELAGALAGMEQGWSESLERLEALVDGDAPPDQDFIIRRELQAPRTLVYKAWTEADRLARWFGPKGFTMLATNLDLRPGGAFHYGMQSPDGKTMWGKWVFREIVPNTRLVFVASFSDEQARVTRHPLAAHWPLEVLSTVTFTDNQGRTLITMRASAINATAEEREMFTSNFAGMTQGWTGTLEQLVEYLEQAGS